MFNVPLHGNITGCCLFDFIVDCKTSPFHTASLAGKEKNPSQKVFNFKPKKKRKNGVVCGPAERCFYLSNRAKKGNPQKPTKSCCPLWFFLGKTKVSAAFAPPRSASRSQPWTPFCALLLRTPPWMVCLPPSRPASSCCARRCRFRCGGEGQVPLNQGWQGDLCAQRR